MAKYESIITSKGGKYAANEDSRDTAYEAGYKYGMYKSTGPMDWFHPANKEAYEMGRLDGEADRESMPKQSNITTEALIETLQIAYQQGIVSLEDLRKLLGCDIIPT